MQKVRKKLENSKVMQDLLRGCRIRAYDSAVFMFRKHYLHTLKMHNVMDKTKAWAKEYQDKASLWNV